MHHMEWHDWRMRRPHSASNRACPRSTSPRKLRLPLVPYHDEQEVYAGVYDAEAAPVYFELLR